MLDLLVGGLLVFVSLVMGWGMGRVSNTTNRK